MKTLTISTLSALVIAAPLTALAQTEYQAAGPSFDNRWYVAPFAMYTWADSNRNMDNNWGGGLAVGKPLSKWFNLELRATYTELSSNWTVDGWRMVNGKRRSQSLTVDGKDKVFDVGVDGLFFFSRGRFQPFLLFGVGAIQDNVELCTVGYCASNSKWSFMGEAGLGFVVPINDYISFRMDARYRVDSGYSYNDYTGRVYNDHTLGDVIATAGIMIPLGSRGAPPKVTRTYELSADALFGFNEYHLTPTGLNTINTFSRDLGQATYDGIRVAGHTDPIGSEAYNLALSDRRANTVREQLVTDGVPGDRITAQGYGKTQLKVTPADCAAAKSREALIACYGPNRRVEVTVEGMTAKQ